MVELLEYESHPQPLETLRPIVDIGVSHFAMTVDNLKMSPLFLDFHFSLLTTRTLNPFS